MIKVILIVTALLLMMYISYKVSEPYVAKTTTIAILNRFKKGNLILIGSNNNVIFKKINDDKLPINRIYINNEDSFFMNVYSKSDLGLGESYMRDEWITDDLPGLLLVLALNTKDISNAMSDSYYNFFSHSADYDKTNIKHHYDVGNDFYLKFLTDDLSAYSCGFWFNENDTLNDAQFNKVNTIIQKIATDPKKKILDIGCGWGKIANYVAQKTDCHVTGITVSDEQAKYAKQNYDPEKVSILNMDYRLLNDKFDHIYSIGMFEHVRFENYDSFFQMIKRCLKTHGRFVLHTIISLEKTDPAYVRESFISKHIFPGGQIPNNDWITNAVLRNGLNIIHFEGYGGQHYAKTLKIWRENMLKEKDYILENYGNELLKKYEFYFDLCSAGFSTGGMGIGHYVITNEDVVTTDNSFNYSLSNNI